MVLDFKTKIIKEELHVYVRYECGTLQIRVFYLLLLTGCK